MHDDFQRIKSALSIRDVITAQTGLTIGSSGHLQECPFCHGKDCFSIPKTGNYEGTFKCFQCPEKGDVFIFLEKYLQLDREGALKKAAELAGIELEQKKPKSAPRLSQVDKIRLAAADYYHSHMLQNGGREYFVDRRGHEEQTLLREKVGWSDGRLLDHLREQGFGEREILESGLVKEKEIEGAKRLLDFFAKGLAIFPHYGGGRVLHFTMKDPRDIPAAEKLKYQLPNDFRDTRWVFYGQDVLDRHNEIIVVEGENDRLQVLNAGISYVMAMIGQISDAQIKALSKKCRGKHLYLWVDNDAAGDQYVRKICAALGSDISVRIIAYGKPGDDPDSYLKRFEGNRKQEIRRLQLEALDYVSWEILRAAVLPSLEEKLKHLKDHKVFRAIGSQPAIQQDVFKEKLSHLGFSPKAVEQQLDFSQDLMNQIHEYMVGFENPKDADPIVLGEICFKFFAHHGRFYFDSEDRVWLIYQNRTYEVSNGTAFNALMLKLTRMIPEKAPGAQMWSALKHTAYLGGRRIDRCQWIHTDVVRDTIFLNLNGPNNTILKVSRDRIEEIQNGMNDDHVLLSSSSKIMPMNFLPDTDIQEGMTALKELIFDNLAVERKQKYLILSWLISGLCPEFAPYQFLMKFSGYASSGKSTAAKFITTLTYGNDQLSDPSGAAAFSSAAQNPILVIDNLEHKDLTRGMQKFLLLAATRGQKEKRKGGTDRETIDESPRSLVCITAIEPFTLSELISRTFEIPFDRRIHGSDSFYESEVLEQIKKKRDMIMSALLRFIQKDVMSNLDMRKEFMTILNRQYKGHAKDRTNAYLALLMVILSKMLKYIPYWGPEDVMFGVESGETDIYKAWIEEQNAAAKETEQGSNSIIQLLDGLVREHLKLMKEKNVVKGPDPDYEDEVWVLEHPEYSLKMVKTTPETVCAECGKLGGTCACRAETYSKSTIEFVATSAHIVDAFDRYCKSTGKRNPYESASVFIARLRNDRGLLAKSGWEIIETEGKAPYFRVIRGQRYLKMRYTLVR
ncbi:CHC2 zinc finger domain-containing protein [Geoalkalibacter sp.]|uniref:CHC2 zinc finger domain-containing protein n=1 Tax=Geoalkalibacter sp. TaxID=3041440 RepID=UPI00272E1072|nr:toprim domain-containing protein [Geoalkalibacter sp.]